MPDALSLMRERVRVVLVAPHFGGNVGACARAMKTMGLRELVLVTPREHLTPEAVWTAVHAHDVLTAARTVGTVTEATADCVFVVGTSVRARHLPLPVLEPRAAAAAMIAAAADGPVAVLFGNETSGLSGEVLSRCNLHVRIPADAQYSSLNLAMAVQLLSYELRLAALAAAGLAGAPADAEVAPASARDDGRGARRASARRAGRSLATAEQLAHLLAHAQRTLIRIGFHDPHKPRLLLQRLRRLFGRARLESAEAHLLRGILASVDRAAESPATPYREVDTG